MDIGFCTWLFAISVATSTLGGALDLVRNLFHRLGPDCRANRVTTRGLNQSRLLILPDHDTGIEHHPHGRNIGYIHGWRHASSTLNVTIIRPRLRQNKLRS